MSGLPTTSAFNDGYIAELYDAYRRDPASVDESWRQFFRFAESLGRAEAAPGGGTFDASILRKTAGAAGLVAAIERFGHLAVPIDPLGSTPPGAAELEPEFHGISESDLDDVPAAALGRSERGTAADLVHRLRELYCTSLGYEFEHVSDETERQWLRATIESGEASEPLTLDEKKALLDRLTAVDALERFLGRAYVSVKRFSIEGVDALVPMLDEAIARGADAGARQVVLGMAHRGRLNVMTHVMGKSYRALFEEFEGWPVAMASDSDTGDVKYHMGFAAKIDVAGTGTVTVELMSNPSHLELVNPVAQGVARARQRAGGSAPNTRDESSARSTSSPTTRSGSRLTRSTAARRTTRATWRRDSRSRSCTSTPTTPKGACRRCVWRSRTVVVSTRIFSSTSWATAATATTRRISPRSRSL